MFRRAGGGGLFGAHPLGRAVIGGRRERRARRHRRAAAAPSTDEALLTPADRHRRRGGFARSRRRSSALAQRARRSRVGENEAGDDPPPGGATTTTPTPPGEPGFERRVRFLRKDTEQYHFCLGGRGISRHDERRFALRVLEGVLGGTTSSRLFQAVRERRGLAYSGVLLLEPLRRHGRGRAVRRHRGPRTSDGGRCSRRSPGELERAVAGTPRVHRELDRSRENLKEQGQSSLRWRSTTARA